jgi:hypothetical protein
VRAAVSEAKRGLDPALIDEIVVGVRITGDRVGRSGVAGRRIGWRDRLRLDRRCAAEGRVIQDRQIFRDCATGGRIEIFDLGDALSTNQQSGRRSVRGKLIADGIYAWRNPIRSSWPLKS